MIDADVLARAGEVFALRLMPVMTSGQLALRRAVTCRGAAVVKGNRVVLAESGRARALGQVLPQ